MPLTHHGPFEAYQERYAGLIDVIIVDPPYERKALPVYDALAAFARATLRPGGWLLCLTGHPIAWEVQGSLRAAGLTFLNQHTYYWVGTKSQGHAWTSTGEHTWQEHTKPLLQFEQPGTLPNPQHKNTAERRDKWTSDFIEASDDYDKEVFRDQQSLIGFQHIINTYTRTADVILDCCMGSGTTLVAALTRARTRVIGIEKEKDTYAIAQERLAAWSSHAPTSDKPYYVNLEFP